MLLTDGVDPGLALLKPVASADPVYFVLVLLKLRYLNNKKTDLDLIRREKTNAVDWRIRNRIVLLDLDSNLVCWISNRRIRPFQILYFVNTEHFCWNFFNIEQQINLLLCENSNYEIVHCQEQQEMVLKKIYEPYIQPDRQIMYW